MDVLPQQMRACLMTQEVAQLEALVKPKLRQCVDLGDGALC